MGKGQKDQMFRAMVRYAKKGWHVIVAKEKRAIIPSWPARATTDETQIRQWCDEHPNANPAIVTGRLSGLLILDVDNKRGKDGARTLRELEQELIELPATYEVITPNGKHLYFNHPGGAIPNSVGQVGEGIDIEAVEFSDFHQHVDF